MTSNVKRDTEVQHAFEGIEDELSEQVSARRARRGERDPWTLRLSDPRWLRGAGWLIEVSLSKRGSYSGPEATLVLCPDDHTTDVRANAARVIAAAAALGQGDAWAAALERPLAATLGLPEVEFAEWMFETSDDDRTRRATSLATMRDRFPAAAQHFERVYGLRLPQHLAVFAAFWDSLSHWEREAVRYLGLYPAGITAYFHGPDTRLVARDGLDERLDMRFWCDSPELVTFMAGQFDGLHFGLWYDDPQELPSFVVRCYARDSGEIWTDRGASGLAAVRTQVERAFEAAREDDLPALRWRLMPLTNALEDFADADRDAVEADGPRRWADAPRLVVTGGVGPALPEGSGEPRDSWEEFMRRGDAYRSRSPEVRQWITEARRELADRMPAFALVLGLELRRRNVDEYRDDCIELLTGAYELLGRSALAEIAKVDHAHRDLDNVAVLEAKTSGTPL